MSCVRGGRLLFFKVPSHHLTRSLFSSSTIPSHLGAFLGFEGISCLSTATSDHPSALQSSRSFPLHEKEKKNLVLCSHSESAKIFESALPLVQVGLAFRYCSSYASGMVDIRSRHSDYSRNVQDQIRSHSGSKTMMTPSEPKTVDISSRNEVGSPSRKRIGENISTADKRKFLLNMLFDLQDSKEAVYGALDGWVAWERNFPLVTLKRALLTLEKEEQWHKVVQIIKWMLSKGQGTTMGTYEQLIRALEKDHRAEEAHKIWVKKIGKDLHSVPWRVCDLMISIYYRNNMLERLVKLFKDLEAFDRKPPGKAIVRKVTDAHELLGSIDEKSRILEKYHDLFSESSRVRSKKSRKISKEREMKTGNNMKLRTPEDSENGSVPCSLSDTEDDAL